MNVAVSRQLCSGLPGDPDMTNELPIVSVTELVTAMKEVIETALPPCIVEAELSNCRRSAAGHRSEEHTSEL